MCLAPSETQLLQFPEVLFFRSVDAFPLSCGGESWIDHYLAYGISRLRNYYLQVQVWHAWDHNGLRSSTVRVHRVDTRARTPTLRYLDPCSLISGSMRGQFLYHAGKDLEAVAQFKATLDMEPRFWVGQICAAKVYEKLWRQGESRSQNQ